MRYSRGGLPLTCSVPWQMRISHKFVYGVQLPCLAMILCSCVRKFETEPVTHRTARSVQSCDLAQDVPKSQPVGETNWLQDFSRRVKVGVQELAAKPESVQIRRSSEISRIITLIQETTSRIRDFQRPHRSANSRIISICICIGTLLGQ